MGTPWPGLLTRRPYPLTQRRTQQSLRGLAVRPLAEVILPVARDHRVIFALGLVTHASRLPRQSLCYFRIIRGDAGTSRSLLPHHSGHSGKLTEAPGIKAEATFFLTSWDFPDVHP